MKSYNEMRRFFILIPYHTWQENVTRIRRFAAFAGWLKNALHVRIKKAFLKGIQLCLLFFCCFFFCCCCLGERGSKYHYKQTIIGPPAKRHLNGVSRRADGGPTLIAGLVALWFYRGSGTKLLRNPIFLWFFREGSGPPPPLNPRMLWYQWEARGTKQT